MCLAITVITIQITACPTCTFSTHNTVQHGRNRPAGEVKEHVHLDKPLAYGFLLMPSKFLGLPKECRGCPIESEAAYNKCWPR